jgi:hypothetical protein
MGLAMTGAQELRSSERDRYTNQLVRIAKGLWSNRTLLNWMREADEGRRTQNEHGTEHHRSVWKVGGYIGKRCQFTKRERALTAIACAGHDVGSCIGQVGHEEKGAEMMYNLTLELGACEPDAWEVYWLIAHHRTSQIMANGISSRPHAALVLADKAVGDELRVREDVRQTLDSHARTGSLHEWRRIEAEEWDDGNPDKRHARINFAIRHARLIVDSDCPDLSEVVLSMKLKTSIASHEEVLDLFGLRYRVSHMAATHLDHALRVDFNGHRVRWDEDSNCWQWVDGCKLLPN